MFGPEILARTMTVPTTGSGSKPFKYGNRWQYHSRSDRHSKVACWGLTFDLLRICSLLQAHVAAGKVSLGINHELRDFRNNKKKNLDLVLCQSTQNAIAGGSKSGAKGARTFGGLVSSYQIDLTPAERHALDSLPDLPIAGVSNVLVAAEAKAAMTAYAKARPRLHDELTSSHQTIHGDTNHAIAAGLVIVNSAEEFISTDINKWDLATRPAEISKHSQPRDAELIIQGLRNLQRRARVEDVGFDAVGVIVIRCRNDGMSPVEVVTSHPPAPTRTDDFDYERFVNRLSHLYASRFAGI